MAKKNISNEQMLTKKYGHSPQLCLDKVLVLRITLRNCHIFFF